MKRREFLHRAAYAAGAVWLDPKTAAKQTFPLPAQAGKFSASDTVRLGSTGIQTSRLAMGTGTVGSGHHSHQTALGIKGLADLRSEEHTSELQSRLHLVCRLLLEKKKKTTTHVVRLYSCMWPSTLCHLL